MSVKNTLRISTRTCEEKPILRSFHKQARAPAMALACALLSVPWVQRGRYCRHWAGDGPLFPTWCCFFHCFMALFRALRFFFCCFCVCLLLFFRALWERFCAFCCAGFVCVWAVAGPASVRPSTPKSKRQVVFFIMPNTLRCLVPAWGPKVHLTFSPRVFCTANMPD